MDKTTRQLRIRGRVQGVFYRESMRQKALELGINGWVRNRLDGSVEALIQGPPEKIAEIVAWARQGPPRAKVEAVEVETPLTSEIFSSFDRSSDA